MYSYIHYISSQARNGLFCGLNLGVWSAVAEPCCHVVVGGIKHGFNFNFKFLGDESLSSSNRCCLIEWSFEMESAFRSVQE
jgi:hypothetical protein